MKNSGSLRQVNQFVAFELWRQLVRPYQGWVLGFRTVENLTMPSVRMLCQIGLCSTVMIA
jgi:hypothetical protein